MSRMFNPSEIFIIKGWWISTSVTVSLFLALPFCKFLSMTLKIRSLDITGKIKLLSDLFSSLCFVFIINSFLVCCYLEGFMNFPGLCRQDWKLNLLWFINVDFNHYIYFFLIPWFLFWVIGMSISLARWKIISYFELQQYSTNFLTLLFYFFVKNLMVH
jgi:hypothetical protein